MIPRPTPERLRLTERRWCLKKLDTDLFRAAIIAKYWSPCRPPVDNVNAIAIWLREAMHQLCDVAMPRSRPFPKRKSVYWWNFLLSEFRLACNQAKRKLTRSRRKNGPSRIMHDEQMYKKTRKTLRTEIAKAKANSWEELNKTINSDPWGRSYKIVIGRLQGPPTPATSILEPITVTKIIDTLFPVGTPQHLDILQDEKNENAGMEVTPDELEALKKSRARRAAPGPDAIPGLLWNSASNDMLHELRSCYSHCFKQGLFPMIWKTAKLVLLNKKKDGKPDCPSTYRPICILDEAGKLLERITASRIKDHLQFTTGLADSQFGFRDGRSTCDAVLLLQRITQENNSRGWTTVAIGLDIKNAFNSLLWECIHKSLEDWRIPAYIRRIVVLSRWEIRLPSSLPRSSPIA